MNHETPPETLAAEHQQLTIQLRALIERIFGRSLDAMDVRSLAFLVHRRANTGDTPEGFLARVCHLHETNDPITISHAIRQQVHDERNHVMKQLEERHKDDPARLKRLETMKRFVLFTHALREKTMKDEVTSFGGIFTEWLPDWAKTII